MTILCRNDPSSRSAARVSGGPLSGAACPGRHSLEGPSLQHPSIPAPQPPALTHKHISVPLGLVEPLTLLGWGGGSRRRVLGGEGRGH